MAQRTGKLQRSPQLRLPRGLALLLLCVFLCARGLVPAGYMPASVTGGSPYGLCHGDSRSAQLLQWLAAQEQHHDHSSSHQHDALTAQAFADNHCSFATSAVVAAAPAPVVPFIATGAQPALSSNAPTPLGRRNFLLPPSRAPPTFPFA